MTEEDEKPAEPSEVADEIEQEEDPKLRNLLRGAFLEQEGDVAPRSDVLRGVQERIRKRSGGKFYADGWSTERHPPIQTYLLTSLFMLLFAVVVYIILSPTAGEPVEVVNEPAPVRVVPPRPAPSP
jgi:hypothetical protein